jgi:anti-sigma factor ChrR (cupin superfamily)
MMTCHDVSTLVATGGLIEAPLMRRLSVRVHLGMCDHCRTFRRQIEVIARAARAAGLTFERELSEDFEARVVKRLQPSVGGSP